MSYRRHNLWRTALMSGRKECRYCKVLIKTPEMGFNKTKLRWAIYRHLQAAHPQEFEYHFPNCRG
jgi:hypothetical protein